jgi:hypothetical protein
MALPAPNAMDSTAEDLASYLVQQLKLYVYFSVPLDLIVTGKLVKQLESGSWLLSQVSLHQANQPWLSW